MSKFGRTKVSNSTEKTAGQTKECWKLLDCLTVALSQHFVSLYRNSRSICLAKQTKMLARSETSHNTGKLMVIYNMLKSALLSTSKQVFRLYCVELCHHVLKPDIIYLLFSMQSVENMLAVGAGIFARRSYRVFKADIYSDTAGKCWLVLIGINTLL